MPLVWVVLDASEVIEGVEVDIAVQLGGESVEAGDFPPLLKRTRILALTTSSS